MAKFKVVAFSDALKGQPAGSTMESAYELELEALGSIDAEVVETSTTVEEEFIEAARDADAIRRVDRR